MKRTTSQPLIKVRLFVLVLFATCGFAAAAGAQSSSWVPAVTIRFNLPFEAYWGTKLLPAGQYSMRMDNSHPSAIVQSANGKTAFFTPIPTRNRSDKGPAALFVVVRGNERMIRSLNLPKSDLSLTYQPTTSAELEILANADQVREVPLTIAGK